MIIHNRKNIEKHFLKNMQKRCRFERRRRCHLKRQIESNYLMVTTIKIKYLDLELNGLNHLVTLFFQFEFSQTKNGHL